MNTELDKELKNAAKGENVVKSKRGHDLADLENLHNKN